MKFTRLSIKKMRIGFLLLLMINYLLFMTICQLTQPTTAEFNDQARIKGHISADKEFNQDHDQNHSVEKKQDHDRSQGQAKEQEQDQSQDQAQEKDQEQAEEKEQDQEKSQSQEQEQSQEREQNHNQEET